MTARQLVSITIAAFRSRDDHLSAAISSALAQSWAELEVIVSDDSPDDRLRVLVASFRDPRLRYRHNLPALGVARNHWAMFAEARGEYVVVLNHDDWLAPGCVERLAGVLSAQPDAVLAFCDHWVIDARGRRLDDASTSNSMQWGRMRLAEGLHRPFVQLVRDQAIPMALGAMFRRSALPIDLPADAGPAYDLWLTYLLCREGAGAWFVRERLAAWRTHGDSLSSEGGLSWQRGAAQCWQAIAADPQFEAVRNTARRNAALGYYGCAKRSWLSGQRSDCLRYTWRSLRTLPSLRGVAALLLPLLPPRLAAMRR